MTEKEVFVLRRKYFKMVNNLVKAIKHSFVSDNERKVMESEIKRAEKEWKEAEEQLR